MTSTTRASARARPPRWLVALWILAAAVLGLTRLVEIAGDPALSNLAGLLTVTVVATVSFFWFALTRSPRGRWATLLAGLVAVAAFLVVFRLEAVTGALMPSLHLRWSGSGDSGPLPRVLDGPEIRVGAAAAGDFPGFLGSDRSQRVDGPRLATDWRARPPELLWRQPIGAGWSAFAIASGYAVTLEQRAEGESVTLYEVDSGALRWVHVVERAEFANVTAGDGPRSTPSLDAGVVYALSVFGKLLALDAATGREIWSRDLLEDYGISRRSESKSLPYGRPNSPLVTDRLVVVPVGGPARPGRVGVAAFDKRDGSPVWEAGDFQISMSSPARARLAEIDQVLVVHEDWASGHAIDDGRQLWQVEWPGKSDGNANVSQPVPLPPDGFLLSKGYGQGAARYRLVPGGAGELVPQQLWHTSRSLRTKFTNLSLRDGYAYGLSEGVLECVDLETGERVWKGGRYGHGQMLMVGDLLLVLSEEGELFLVEATPERPNHVLSQIQVLSGKTWNNLALAGDRLLVRNAREAAAYRLPRL